MMMKIQSLFIRWKSLFEIMIILCSLLLVVLFYGGIIPKVRFVSEIVHLRIDEEYINAEVIFHYANRFPFPVTQGFSFPTPSDDGMSEPEYITAGELDEKTGLYKRLLPIDYLGSIPRFQTGFGPFEEKNIRVLYSQKHDGNKAKYLLTTTEKWKRPIKNGDYIVTLDHVEIIHSNYSLKKKDDNSFWFNKNEFMPLKDWDLNIRVAR